MKKYTSKIHFSIIFSVFLYMIPLVILIIKGTLFSLFFGMALALIIHTIANTYYVINHEELLIKSGILFKRIIKISEISRVEKYNWSYLDRTFNVSLSPDRIKIIYQKENYIIISPKDKEAFIKDLLKINTEIEVALEK